MIPEQTCWGMKYKGQGKSDMGDGEVILEARAVRSRGAQTGGASAPSLRVGRKHYSSPM